MQEHQELSLVLSCVCLSIEWVITESLGAASGFLSFSFWAIVKNIALTLLQSESERDDVSKCWNNKYVWKF